MERQLDTRGGRVPAGRSSQASTRLAGKSLVQGSTARQGATQARVVDSVGQAALVGQSA